MRSIMAVAITSAAGHRGRLGARRLAGMSRQQRQRRRCHALDARGLTEGLGRTGSSLALISFDNPASPLKSSLVQARPLVPTEGRDVGLLAVEIDRIGGVRLQPLLHRRRTAARSGQTRARSLQPMLRIGQELVGRAADPVLVQLEAMAAASCGVR